MQQTHLKTVPVIQIQHGQATQTHRTIIDEDILKIVVNGAPAFEFVFSKGREKELAVGFLFTQGVIETPGDILEVEFDPVSNQCAMILTPEAESRLTRTQKMVRGSSGGTLTGFQQAECSGDHKTPFLMPEQVSRLMDLHFKHSTLYQQTRAAHSAGITDGTEMLSFFEDIGRHNALDKLAGHILLNKTDVSDKAVTLSCRLSLEIIEKIICTGIPVVVSKAVPTLSALNLAEKHHTTIVSTAPNNTIHIYTCPDRILSSGNRAYSSES